MAKQWYNHATSENIGDEHHQDQQWQNHSILLNVDESGEAQFSWEINSDRGLTMGGWTIDNVCVYGVPKVVETPLDGEDEEDFAGCQSTSMTRFLGRCWFGGSLDSAVEDDVDCMIVCVVSRYILV